MIYLDHNATSPMLPEVRDAMAPWLSVPANPSSVHQAGRRAAAAVERAREHVAALVGGAPSGVVFTSGATEANHLFLRGAALQHAGVLAFSAVEHPCVKAAAAAWWPGRAVELPVDSGGRVVLDDLPDDLAVLSVMAANHETGVIQPVGRAPVRHVDATQAAGRIPLALGDVDGVVLSSHKLGGPGGVGALVLRGAAPFPALLTGGPQERGRRAGTVNTAGVVGFGEACRLATGERAARADRWTRMSHRLRRGLAALGARIVGDPAGLLPNTTCVVFPGLRGDGLVAALDLAGFCVSSGAACASGSQEPSAALRAMGDPEPWGAVRISLGPRQHDGDVDALLDALPAVLRAARDALRWDADG